MYLTACSGHAPLLSHSSLNQTQLIVVSPLQSFVPWYVFDEAINASRSGQVLTSTLLRVHNAPVVTLAVGLEPCCLCWSWMPSTTWFVVRNWHEVLSHGYSSLSSLAFIPPSLILFGARTVLCWLSRCCWVVVGALSLTHPSIRTDPIASFGLGSDFANRKVRVQRLTKELVDEFRTRSIKVKLNMEDLRHL